MAMAAQHLRKTQGSGESPGTARMTTSLVNMLRVPIGGDFLALPRWAGFFVELGETLCARTDEDNRRTIIAIATPTRAFASVLCAVGIVGVRADTSVTTDAMNHFEYLMTLPKGTTVMYQEDLKKRRKGWLLSCVTEKGERFVVVQFHPTRHGGLTYKIPASRSISVQVAGDDMPGMPHEVISRLIRVQPGLMGGILAQSMLSVFLQNSRLECVIVGHESLLREEIQRTQFAVLPPSGAVVLGKLQDILRVRRFAGGSQCYRSELYSATRMEDPAPSDERPPVAIFDGSVAFLRWMTAWPKAHWVVVLDRTDARFDDAAAEINRIYIGERMDRGVSLHSQQVPPSLECMAFELRK